MTQRSRRLALVVALLLVSTTAGCSTLGGADLTTTSVDRGGGLRVVPVAEAPENATVVSFSEVRDAETGVLQSQLQSASESGERTDRGLSPEELSTLADQFEVRDLYNGSDAPVGYYVGFDGDVYSVLLLENQ